MRRRQGIVHAKGDGHAAAAGSAATGRFDRCAFGRIRSRKCLQCDELGGGDSLSRAWVCGEKGGDDFIDGGLGLFGSGILAEGRGRKTL